MPCSSGRTRGTGRYPQVGWVAPEDHERVLRSVIRAAWPDREPTWPAFLGGGRCSASQMRTLTTGSPGPCATPSPTGATAGEAHHRHSPIPHTSGGTGDGPDDGRERVGGGSAVGRPPRRSRAPRTTPPQQYGAMEGLALAPLGGRAETTSAGGNPLPRSPLTADC